jgi:hypothetical protein
MKKLLLYISTAILFIILIGAFMVESSEQNNKVIYYGSFSGYDIPLHPIEKIDEKEALSRKTYCIGIYNTKGQLILFEKHIDGALFFRHEYSYYENGNIKENKGIDADGFSRVNNYDKNGSRIIKNIP